MTDECGKYYLYNRVLKRVLLFSGLWPIRTHHSWIFFHLIPFLHGLSAILATCAILNFCRLHVTNFNLFFKGLSSALSFLTVLQKMICLIFYRKDLVELHVSLDETFLLDLDDAELRPILLSPLVSFYRLSLILSIVACTIMTMFWITPIILIAIQLSRGVLEPKYILPYPTAYPWGIEANGWLYRGLYMFEIYAGVCLLFVTTSADSLFGYYIFQICGQIRTLSYRMRNLSSRTNYRRVLNECISRHQILMRCQDHLERIYGPIVLWLSVTSAMVICALIYQVAHIDSTRAAIITPYIIFKAMQILLYGWFGSYLTTENGMFREAIYASDWAGSGDKHLMTNILTMMNYHNKSFVLKACSVSTISVDMFVTVCNTAVSYYFMFRTVEESRLMK